MSDEQLQEARQRESELVARLQVLRRVIRVAEAAREDDAPAAVRVVRRQKQRVRYSAEDYAADRQKTATKQAAAARQQVRRRTGTAAAARRREVYEYLKEVGPTPIMVIAKELSIPQGSISAVVQHPMFEKRERRLALRES